MGDIKMFQKFFNPENALWKWMGLLSDTMLMTLVWIVFSIPIITIGPATVSLFKVSNDVLSNSGTGVISDFIKYFFLRFKQTVIVGLFSLILMGIVLIDFWFYRQISSSISTFVFFIVIFVSVILFGFLVYFYPMLAVTQLNIMNALKLSFFIEIKHFSWTIFLIVMYLFGIFITTIFAPYLVFFMIGMLSILNMKVFKMLIKEYDLTKFGGINEN